MRAYASHVAIAIIAAAGTAGLILAWPASSDGQHGLSDSSPYTFDAPGDYGGGFLPEAYMDYGILEAAYENHVKEPGDFEAWRKLVLSYGPGNLPAAAPVGDATLVTSSHDGCVAVRMQDLKAADGERIRMAHAAGCRAGPPGPEGRPAVLIIPGAGNTGMRDVLGISGSGIDDYYYHRAIGASLALAGYDVYTFELRGYGLAAYDAHTCDSPKYDRWNVRNLLLECDFDMLRQQLLAAGIDIYDLMLSDAIQVLRHVESVGHKRIAAGGLSLGGNLGAYLGAYERDRLDAVFLASGTGSVTGNPPSKEMALPGMLECCDHADVVAAIAPLPLYISVSENDAGLFATEGRTGAAGALAASAYEEQGGDFVYVKHDLGHAYHMESLEKFLDEYLR